MLKVVRAAVVAHLCVLSVRAAFKPKRICRITLPNDTENTVNIAEFSFDFTGVVFVDAFANRIRSDTRLDRDDIERRHQLEQCHLRRTVVVQDQ